MASCNSRSHARSISTASLSKKPGSSCRRSASSLASSAGSGERSSTANTGSEALLSSIRVRARPAVSAAMKSLRCARLFQAREKARVYLGVPQRLRVCGRPAQMRSGASIVLPGIAPAHRASTAWCKPQGAGTQHFCHDGGQPILGKCSSASPFFEAARPCGRAL